MKAGYLFLKGLFEIWKSRNYDLYFYFQEIFEPVLNASTERTLEDGLQLKNGKGSRYKAFFVPVGFNIENVAVITCLIKPNYLRLAFTEASLRFHRKTLHLVKESIEKVCPAIKITEVRIMSDDQKHAEGKIREWIEEMKAGYGLSYSQMAIDLTGGTKPMSIGAYNAAISYKEIDAFYLRTDYDEDTADPIPGTETLIPLKKEKSQVDKNFMFVIMPFALLYDEIYHWIEEAAKAEGITCFRADKEIFIGGIMDKVRENILKAGIIIAELSEKNPNVYYELGLSHAIGKNVIMLSQSLDSIPFDLKHLKMVLYKADNKDAFINQLSPYIKAFR